MVKKIYDLFYELARQHKQIKSFHYATNRKKGAGNDLYPLVWLEQPLMLQGLNKGALFDCGVNFDVLFVPDYKKHDDAFYQDKLTYIALSFVEKLKAHKISVDNFDIVTLTNYFDDAAVGVRVSLNIALPNDIKICLNDEFYDPDKELKDETLLPTFDTENAEGCAVFTNKPFKDFDINL